MNRITYSHGLQSPGKICALHFDQDGYMCAVSDEAYHISGFFYVNIVNMQYGMTVARLRHINYPASYVLSFKKEEALITATQESVSIWASKGETQKNLFPKVQRTPIEMSVPALEIDLTDCFYKQVNEIFVNLDYLNYSMSITRQVAQCDKKFIYTSYFYAISNAEEGYSHSVSFKTSSAADTITISSDGLFFIVHTVKNAVHLVNTLDGDLVE